MPDFDFIIAGGGVAGLSLAYHLARSPLSRRSILIVEADAQNKKDHALSFWADGPTPFDAIVRCSWDRLQVRCDDQDLPIDLGRYRYHTLRSADFARFITQALAGCANVRLLEGTVDRIEDGMDGARVEVGSQSYSGQWAFDSRFRLAEFNPDAGRYISLRQHFVGWEIETVQPAFDPGALTLFDLRVPQQRELRFFYVLPYTGRRALLEFVQMSPDRGEEMLREYVEKTLGIRHYQILAKEGGVTPLTDYPFPRRAGRRVMAIGVRGGRAKPSAGYAFNRIQRDSRAIVRSLVRTGHPFDVPADGRYYRFCDAALLHAMLNYGDNVKPIYTALFKNNPIERVFHFLDETASPGEALALMHSLPLHLFWKALFQAARPNPGITRRPL